MYPLRQSLQGSEKGAKVQYQTMWADERAIDHRVDSDAGLAQPEGVVRETDYQVTIPFHQCWNTKDANECVSKFLISCERAREMNKHAE